jgi:hemin uptake protein HemP
MSTPPAEPAKDEEPEQELAATAAQLPKIIKFESLARCGDEIWIESEGQIYRLRKTRQGKLILTK